MGQADGDPGIGHRVAALILNGYMGDQETATRFRFVLQLDGAHMQATGAMLLVVVQHTLGDGLGHLATTALETQAACLEDACLCAQLAADFRGKDTIVLDLTDVTPIVDYFVITTGNSPRQLRSLAEEVRQTMKARSKTELVRRAVVVGGAV